MGRYVMTEIQTWWQFTGCMNNPGAFTGEEAARDWEIKQLRAHLTKAAALLAEVVELDQRGDLVDGWGGDSYPSLECNELIKDVKYFLEGE